VVADFLAAHAHVQLELAVSGAIPDIVASGYDAGVELGEVIDRDMVAVPVTGKMRLAVVGSPSYFARHPVPNHPRDLTEHVCINRHATPDAPAYQWEFTEDGRAFSVAVQTRVLCTDGGVILRFARAGVGLAMVYNEQVTDDLARGESRLDDEYGGFLQTVTQAGDPVPGQGGQIRKTLYGNAFAMYCLAAYYGCSADPVGIWKLDGQRRCTIHHHG
jgi:DNA-binding transcriptional LysR family regulator